MKKILIEKFMRRAIELSVEGVKDGKGGPFGAVVVKSGKIIGEGTNCVTSANDPTAHAEIVAIRNACKQIKNFQLKGCEIFASCEPCPMCLGAIYWARPSAIYFACTRNDASDYGFDDSFIYREIKLPIRKRKIKTKQLLKIEALIAFDIWKMKDGRILY